MVAVKEQNETLQQEYLKHHDEPIRMGKSNENLRKGVEHLRSEYEKLQGETRAVE